MADLLARIKRAEELLGQRKPPNVLDSYHPDAAAAIARTALHAATMASDGLPLAPGRAMRPEFAAAALSVGKQVEARLDAEGLLFPPLDEAQLARVAEIGREMHEALGPDPDRVPVFVMSDAAMRVMPGRSNV